MKSTLIIKMLKKTKRSKLNSQKEKELRATKQLKVRISTRLLPTIQKASILIPKCFNHMETEPLLILKRKVSDI